MCATAKQVFGTTKANASPSPLIMCITNHRSCGPDVRQQKQQRLIVRNLNFHAKEEDLAKAFSEFGPLAEVSEERQGEPIG